MCYAPVVPDLGSEEMKAFMAQAKRQIRRQMRSVRAAIPEAAVATRSARIVETLRELPLLRAAKALALFWPISDRREVDLRELDAWARSDGKSLYYPFMDPTPDGYRTGFRPASNPSALANRGRGFLEPPPEAPAAVAGDVDVVCVPALAVSADGHRIGYGAGFYDATLPDVCPPARSVCVAFSFQLLAEVPRQEHDLACDIVVTDRGVLER